MAGCGETQVETQTNTVTVTETKTNTVTETKTVTVTETVTVAGETEVTAMVTGPTMIIPTYEHCSGCKICEFECSIFHYGEPKVADSNIKVYCHDLHRGTVDIAILCMHCTIIRVLLPVRQK